MLGPDTPGTFTTREPSKGWLGDQIEAFMHMQQLGADIVEAGLACMTGHRMTPDLAALCITTYWRRYAAIANYQESRGAAITIQVRAGRRLTAWRPESFFLLRAAATGRPVQPGRCARASPQTLRIFLLDLCVERRRRKFRLVLARCAGGLSWDGPPDGAAGPGGRGGEAAGDAARPPDARDHR